MPFFGKSALKPYFPQEKTFFNAALQRQAPFHAPNSHFRSSAKAALAIRAQPN
ncbi:hypothetical protein [Allofranklinella schreckenbergeri]|uniref:hypothetical protein n=1 Tax=Allofranklinella schreckenbergeri TaxID=1076744 RepID=UPI001EEEF003|nr:hypothetical protein [Allofranklinella schreckenbergeri]